MSGRSNADGFAALLKKHGYEDIECHSYIDIGWWVILDNLLSAISPKVERIAQIKEKFGGLRVYIGAYREDITDEDRAFVHKEIRKAEIMASVTCEYCGSPGEATSEGWIKTLCKEHSSVYERGFES